MSFPRLSLLVVAFGLPLLTGACAAPLAVTAVGYGTDGVSMVETGKSSTDHFASMVSKQDCALWRLFRNQSICRPFEGDQNPYHVDYDTPFRQGGEGGIEYLTPPHAAANAPAASWDAAVYAHPPAAVAASPEPPPPAPPKVQAPQTADATPPTGSSTPPKTIKVKKKQPPTAHSAVRHKPVKKPSQDRAATPL